MKQYQKPIIVLAVLIFVFAAFLGLSYFLKHRDATALRDVAAKHLQSDEAKAAFTDINGTQIALSSYSGKPVVVTSWASWCPQCIDELTLLNEQVTDKNIPVLAINRKESREVAGRYMLEIPPLANVTYILDNQDYYFNSLEGYAMPETIIYGADGEVVFHGHGNTRPDELKAVLGGLQ